MAKRFLLSTPHLSWWEPYWSHCGKAKRIFNPILNRAAITKVIVVAGTCGSLIVLGFRLAFPRLPLGGLWILSVQIPGLFLFFYLMSWVYRAIPHRISIFADRVLVQHGSTARHIYKCNIVAASLIVFTDSRLRLRIRYTSNSRFRSIVLGLASDINIAELEAILGQRFSIRDARQRFSPLGGRANRFARRVSQP